MEQSRSMEQKSTKIHPLALIFKKGVIENPEFSFNHVSIIDHYWVAECNSMFPTKRGYSYDPELCEYPKHPDSNRSYFFWRDYDKLVSYQDSVDNPDYRYSHWRNFVLDGTQNYDYNYSIKIEIELDTPFRNLAKGDIEYIRIITIKKLGLNKQDIKAVSVNYLGKYEEDRFRNSLDSFKQQTLSMTRAESDRYIDQYIKKKKYTDKNKTHVIIIINKGVNIFSNGYHYDPYSELDYQLINGSKIYGKFNVNEEADIPVAVIAPENETATDIAKRNLHYRRNQCVWGLLDCCCVSSTVCSKIETFIYCRNTNQRIISLGVDQSNTLETRMRKLKCC